MIYFKYKNVEYGIQFKYFNKQTALDDAKGTPFHAVIRHCPYQDFLTPGRITACAVMMVNIPKNFDNVVGVGVAIQHPNDSFNFETGRKCALARTINNHNRDFRTAVWSAYFNRNKPNEPNNSIELSKQRRHSI